MTQPQNKKPIDEETKIAIEVKTIESGVASESEKSIESNKSGESPAKIENPTNQDTPRDQNVEKANDKELADIQKQIEDEIQKANQAADVLEISKDDPRPSHIATKEDEATILTPAMFMTNKPIVGGIKPKKTQPKFDTKHYSNRVKILIPITIGVVFLIISGVIYFFIAKQQPVPVQEEVVTQPTKYTIEGLSMMPAHPQEDLTIKSIILAEERLSDQPELKLKFLKANVDINALDTELQSIKISK